MSINFKQTTANMFFPKKIQWHIIEIYSHKRQIKHLKNLLQMSFDMLPWFSF